MDFPLPTLQPPTSWPLVPALVSGRREGQNSCGAFHQTHARLHRIEALLPVRIASFRPIATAPKIEVPSTLPPSGSSVGTHLDQKMMWSFGACSSHKKKGATTLTIALDFLQLALSYRISGGHFRIHTKILNATARLDLFDRIDPGTHTCITARPTRPPNRQRKYLRFFQMLSILRSSSL